MFAPESIASAEALLAACRRKGLLLATAESCTGGLLAALLTEIPGASDVFERGFVTYSNRAKTEMLGVENAAIDAHGAVSAEVAAAMAQGAMRHSPADIACAITGIAGPDGGTADKPVGLVYIAVATKDNIVVENNRFKGTRTLIRLQSAGKAVDMLKDMVSRSFVYVA